MKNLIERITDIMPSKTFTLDELHRFIQKNLKHPTIQQLSQNADYPYFQKNYLAAILRNYATKRKNPKLQRRLNAKGVYEYSLK